MSLKTYVYLGLTLIIYGACPPVRGQSLLGPQREALVDIETLSVAGDYTTIYGYVSSRVPISGDYFVDRLTELEWRLMSVKVGEVTVDGLISYAPIRAVSKTNNHVTQVNAVVFFHLEDERWKLLNMPFFGPELAYLSIPTNLFNRDLVSPPIIPTKGSLTRYQGSIPAGRISVNYEFLDDPTSDGVDSPLLVWSSDSDVTPNLNYDINANLYTVSYGERRMDFSHKDTVLYDHTLATIMIYKTPRGDCGNESDIRDFIKHNLIDLISTN